MFHWPAWFIQSRQRLGNSPYSIYVYIEREGESVCYRDVQYMYTLENQIFLLFMLSNKNHLTYTIIWRSIFFRQWYNNLVILQQSMCWVSKSLQFHHESQGTTAPFTHNAKARSLATTCGIEAKAVKEAFLSGTSEGRWFNQGFLVVKSFQILWMLSLLLSELT